MKKIISRSIKIILMFLMLHAVNVTAQVGPVVSISETPQSLPSEIKEFFKSYFPNEKAVKIELKTLQNMYEVELDNGYDIKFNSNGGWIEIEAPDNDYISHKILRELLPGSIYDFLKKRYVLNKIEEMNFNPVHGYKIEADNKKDMYFDLNGNESDRPTVFDDYD